MPRPYLSPEFNETIAEQDIAFKNYNKLLDTVNPERIATALSAKALDLSFEPGDDLDKDILDAAEEVLNKTNNGTQIGFGKENGSADIVWGIIHNDPRHQESARRFNALKYSPDADLTTLEDLCKKRGFATLAAMAHMHAMANQANAEQASAA